MSVVDRSDRRIPRGSLRCDQDGVESDEVNRDKIEKRIAARALDVKRAALDLRQKPVL